MSVISAIGLTCDNCKFTNTYGTAPGAGIDFEPNQSNQYLQNIVITNSTITGNQGHGVWGYFGLGPTTSAPVSITVDNCTITGNSNTWYGDKTKQATVDMTVLGPYKGFVKFNGTYLMNK
jgi:hypothetical protein